MNFIGSLCAGVGGFEVGAQMANADQFVVRWQVENDAYCRRVLEHHWPTVARYDDLTTLTGDELAPVDVITCGFPCQPFSVASVTRKGRRDDRYIWPHIIRICRHVHPRWIVLENVPGLLTVDRGFAFAEILGDLDQCGYDAEWAVLSAADIAHAPQLRKRLFIIGMADTNHPRRQEQRRPVAMDTELRPAERRRLTTGRFFGGDCRGPWPPEPRLDRVVDGFSGRVSEIRALANAVVPAVAAWIFERIIEIENDTT